jgi:hypothetical protein
VPAGTRDIDRSLAVRRVAKVSHAKAAGSRSQPKTLPRSRRMAVDAWAAGEHAISPYCGAERVFKKAAMNKRANMRSVVEGSA